MSNPLWDLLEIPASVDPGREILSQGGRRTTLAELATQARALAGHLGEGPVAVMDVNSDLYLRLLFAAFAAETTIQLVNYRLREAELATILKVGGARGLVVGARYADLAARAAARASLAWTGVLDPANGAIAVTRHCPPTPGTDTGSLTLFTSGTTALPKPVEFAPIQLAGYVMTTTPLCDAAAATESTLLSMPLYHVAGLVGALRGVFAGRRLVVQDQFDAAGFIDTVAAEAVTHAFVVPTMLDRVLELASGRSDDLATLRVISYGGGPMPRAVIERALKALPHVEFVSTYGMTEAGGTVSVLDAPDHAAARAGDPDALRRLGSVGRALPDIEVSVRDESGARVPAGTTGEVYVAGDRVPRAASHPELGERWLCTGDLGHLDEAGYLFLHGRADDVIIRGGENIVPTEIEDVLRSHPLVRDCAVLGVADPEWGQRVVAVVVPGGGLTAAELTSHLRDRMASFKVPQTLLASTELPRNATGKVLRRELLARLDRLAVLP